MKHGMRIAGVALLAALACNVSLAHDWSGLYAGAHAGFFSAKPDYREADSPEVNVDPKMDGASVGVLLGYNRQAGSLVYGVEFDFGLPNADAGPDINPGANEFSAFDVDWNAHVRARIGKSMGKSLLYATGGLAALRFNIDDTDEGWGDVNSSHVGWSIGCGFERAFTERWSLRLEYVYDDYGSENGEQSFEGTPIIDFTTSPTAHAGRVALSYNF